MESEEDGREFAIEKVIDIIERLEYMWCGGLGLSESN